MSMSKWRMGAVSAALVLAGCHLVAGLGDVDEVNGGGGAGAQGGGGSGMCDAAACDAMDQECLDFSCEMGTGHCNMGVAVAEGQPCLITTTDKCDSLGMCVNDFCVNGALDVTSGETDADCGGPNCSPCDNMKTCVKPSDCRSNNCVGGGGGAGGMGGGGAGGGGALGTCEPCTDAGGECGAGTYCDDENADTAEQICKPQKPNGDMCASTEQCSSGFCVDGVCCDTACDSADCESCLGAHTGGVDGTCGFVKEDTDPNNDCTENITGSTVNGCEGNACSGNAAACKPAAAKVCRPGGGCDVEESCAGGLGCPPDVLVMSGMSGMMCGGYLCDGNAACPTTCADDGDCEATHYCNGNSCDPRKPLGAVCAPDGMTSECVSGHCVDGVCCGVGSCLDCQECTAAAGTCVNVGTGDQDNDSCNGAGQACDGGSGAGACK